MKPPTPLLRLLFWAAALFALVMALLPHPPDLPGHPSDKVQHITAFAVLGVIGSVAYQAWRPRRLLVGLSLFGALIEILQAVPALHRDSDPLDWLADTLACAIAIGAVRWARKRRADALPPAQVGPISPDKEPRDTHDPV